MRLDAVLKIGGSLSRGDGLPELCAEIGRLGGTFRLVVVPGGGAFADEVRRMYRKYRLGETAAHSMALLAMDQYGHLVHHLIKGSVLETRPESARRTAASGRVAVLLPSASVLRTSGLPHCWQVTSDTVAAWVAREAGCPRLVLLKDVDGLMPPEGAGGASPGCIGEMTVGQLAGHAGGVDAYLSRFLASAAMETWIVSGLKPARLKALLRSGTTTGTRIRPQVR